MFQVVIIQCGLCEVQCSQASEIHKHVLQKHVVAPTVFYVCPLCEDRLSDSDMLVAHFMQDHVEEDMKVPCCPICQIGELVNYNQL